MDESGAKLEVELTNEKRISMTLDGTANNLANLAVAAVAQIMVDSSESWNEVLKHVQDVDLALAAFLKEYWNNKIAKKSAATGVAADAAQNVMQEA